MNFSETLLDWYDRNRRQLPWRDSGDPYRIWLSEIMLQQTRTETVERYYHRFLERFPTVFDLAFASEDEVLKLWEGLGYYSRARNLWSAAKTVALERNGSFPENAAALRALPGVGPYAANAIASIAYGECVPALDGNQARVLSRVTAWESPLRTPFDLLDVAMEHISPSRPGDYNQALMDLGASICTPRNPSCADCPVSGFCLAFQEGDPANYPRKQPPVPKREIDLIIVVAVDDGGVYVHRRPSRGLLAGLYEFATVDGHPDCDSLISSMEAMGFRGAQMVSSLPDARHIFTHLIWRMKGAMVRIEAAPESFRRVESLASIAFPSALRTYREFAEDYLKESSV